MCLTKQPLKKLAILNHKKGSVLSFFLCVIFYRQEAAPLVVLVVLVLDLVELMKLWTILRYI